MKSYLSIRLATISVVIGISAIGVIAYTRGYRGNVDSTYPVGLYRLNHPSSEHFHGELVLFCPPVDTLLQEALEQDIISDGFCQGCVEPFVQQIIAMPGDRVDIRSDKVFVNNQEVPLTHPLTTPYETKDASFTLQLNQFFMIADHHSSDNMDSREFGSVQNNHIIASLEPVWILRGEHRPHEDVSEDE